MSSTPADAVHLRRATTLGVYIAPISCGITGRVSITPTFSEVTCDDCVTAEVQRRATVNGSTR